MATSIDESFIKGALEYQQSRFFQTLPPELSATSRQQRWVAYILSLSQSSTPSGTNSLIPTTASGPVEHAPPLPAVVPDAKRRRLVGAIGLLLKCNADPVKEFRYFATCSSCVSVPPALAAKPFQQISRRTLSTHQYGSSCSNTSPQPVVQLQYSKAASSSTSNPSAVGHPAATSVDIKKNSNHPRPRV